MSQWQQPATHSPAAHPRTHAQFCHIHTLKRLQALKEVAGCEAKLRMEGSKPYVTDNSNYIVDLYFQTPIKDAPAGACACCARGGACCAWGRTRLGMHAQATLPHRRTHKP